MKLTTHNGYAIYFVLLFFGIASMGITSLGGLAGSNLRQSDYLVKSHQAFYLAEAATESAKIVLRDNYDTTPYDDVDSATVTFGAGEYFYNLDASSDADVTKRQITGFGAVPNFAAPESVRAVQVVVRTPPTLPGNFWDYAIYSAGLVDLRGNTYDVNGDVIGADGIDYSHDRITGTEEIDPSINPLASLDFQALQAVAESQVYGGHDNYYTNAEVDAGSPAFPTSFYFEAPSMANPLGIPNVVYIEGDLTLNGNWPNVGGFLIVVGNVDTGNSGDTTINGNGEIDGVIYTLGDFTVNGGGGGLNVLGGVICGETARLNGNTNVTYHQPYMDSIAALNPPPGMTVLSWSEIAAD